MRKIKKNKLHLVDVCVPRLDASNNTVDVSRLGKLVLKSADAVNAEMLSENSLYFRKK